MGTYQELHVPACGLLMEANRLTEAHGGREARGGIAMTARHLLELVLALSR